MIENVKYLQHKYRKTILQYWAPQLKNRIHIFLVIIPSFFTFHFFSAKN